MYIDIYIYIYIHNGQCLSLRKTNYFQRHFLARRVSGDTHLFSRANTYYKKLFLQIYMMYRNH